jgi:hypothetical protein
MNRALKLRAYRCWRRLALLGAWQLVCLGLLAPASWTLISWPSIRSLFTTSHESRDSALLSKVFVAISSHFDARRLVFLEQSLRSISEWQTDVRVCIGTDRSVS